MKRVRPYTKINGRRTICLYWSIKNNKFYFEEWWQLICLCQEVLRVRVNLLLLLMCFPIYALKIAVRIKGCLDSRRVQIKE